MHDFSGKGVRARSEVALVMPLPVPIPPSPAASQALLAAFAERGIDVGAERGVRALDPTAGSACSPTTPELPYDLFLGCQHQVARRSSRHSGLAVDGWIPVDPYTLETSVPDVYAVGDVTSVGTPKAGVFSEGQARVVADAIIARHVAATPRPTTGAASATSSSATARWARSRSPSSPVPTPVGSSPARRRDRRRQGRVRRSASAAGSAASGRTSDRQSPPLKRPRSRRRTAGAACPC